MAEDDLIIDPALRSKKLRVGAGVDDRACQSEGPRVQVEPQHDLRRSRERLRRESTSRQKTQDEPYGQAKRPRSHWQPPSKTRACSARSAGGASVNEPRLISGATAS